MCSPHPDYAIPPGRTSAPGNHPCVSSWFSKDCGDGGGGRGTSKDFFGAPQPVVCPNITLKYTLALYTSFIILSQKSSLNALKNSAAN